MHREKRTFSGQLLEVDFYPVFSDGRRIPARAPKTKRSTQEQKKYNQAQTTKKFIRLANANFDNTDYLMHPTYLSELAPQSEEEARKDIVNYLRRVKTKRASELKRLQKLLKNALGAAMQIGHPSYIDEKIEELKSRIKKLEKPFKYIYVMEKQIYKSGARAGRVNWHFHMFITGGLDDKVLERMWHNGVRVNCDNYQPEKFGPEAAARYMSKDPQGAKRFSYSRNLDKPVEKVRDNKASRKTVEKMAIERVDDREYWENRYKGYRFIRCFSRYNKFNGHWYVSAIMYKADKNIYLPKWEVEEWLEE